MPKEVKLLLATSIICALLAIGAVFIIVQGGIVAIRKTNASIFDVFNARMT